MIRSAAFGAAVVALSFTLPVQAQPADAGRQRQVEQPAPDLENLKEEDLNRTKAAQRLPERDQTAALPGPEAVAEWETRLAENPQVLERDAPVREAWAAVRESHDALRKADGATRQEAQEAYEESLELLRRAWAEATTD